MEKAMMSMEQKDGALVKALAGSVAKFQKEAEELDLPTKGEHFFYKNDSNFSSVCKEQQERIVGILGRLPGIEKKQLSGLLPEDGDEDEAETCIEDVLGDVMVRLGVFLDRHRSGLKAGGKRNLETQQAGSSSAQIAKRNKSLKSVFTPEGSDSIPRPQETFETAVDNSNSPFVHRWCLEGDSDAPSNSNASKSCPKAMRLASHARGLRARQGAEQLHPLHDTLQDLQYSTWQLEEVPPIAPSSLDDTPFEYVDTVEELDELVDSLAGAREVAVDLEAHKYRSFMGFTCLMQISTREGDWVVDTLKLRSHIGPKLGRMFADPGVQKVLHGADSDVEWLQRDFGIYVVNMFDTGQAARVLEMPSFGLAYLLDHYCAFKADKRLQLADWRGRPLSDKMLQYARMDTHFLLYIHDRLKAELVAKTTSVVPELRVPIRPSSGAPDSPLGTVLERSWKLCHKLFEKELADETTYIADLAKYKGVPLSSEETAVFAALFNWRDGVARKEDESSGYVMSRATMIDVARTMPTTRAKLLAVRNLSPLVTGSSEKMLRIISEAKKQAAPVEASSKPPASAAEPKEPTASPRGATKVSSTAQGTASAPGTSSKASPVKPMVRMAPASSKPAGGMASLLGRKAPSATAAAAASALGGTVPKAPGASIPALPKAPPRTGGLGALLGNNNKKASAPPPSPAATKASSSPLPNPEQQQSSALAVLLQGRLRPIASGNADDNSGSGGASAATAVPRGSSQALRNTLAGALPSTASRSKLQEVKASFALPFSLLAPERSVGEGPGGAAGVPEAEAERDGSSAAAKDEDDAGDAEAQGDGQTVSGWLEQVRRGERQDEAGADVGQSSSPALAPMEPEEGDADDAEEPREFEEYLPMSLNETYRHKKKPHRHQQPRGNDPAPAGRNSGGTDKAANVVPFDYSAVAAETPGLSSAFQPQRAGSKWRDFNAERGLDRRGRGRGRGGGGRGGNAKPQQGRGRSSTAGAGQKRGMHEIDPESLMKGGKRSSVHVRSGNRTSHFK